VRPSNTDDTKRLQKLISDGQYDALKVLLGETPSLATVRSSDGRGPLFWAHEYSQQKMVSLLILNGADATATDKDGRAPGRLCGMGFVNFEIRIIRRSYRKQKKLSEKIGGGVFMKTLIKQHGGCVFQRNQQMLRCLILPHGTAAQRLNRSLSMWFNTTNDEQIQMQ
jgi:hypothetical protein